MQVRATGLNCKNSMDENRRALQTWLKQKRPCLLEAVELANYVFANSGEDERFEMTFLILDYVFDQGVAIQELIEQCFYTSRERKDTDFAKLVLYWESVQTEVGGVDVGGYEAVDRLSEFVAGSAIAR